jgi:hypothetical protein
VEAEHVGVAERARAAPISVQCLIFHATIVKIRCSLTL